MIVLSLLACRAPADGELEVQLNTEHVEVPSDGGSWGDWETEEPPTLPPSGGKQGTTGDTASPEDTAAPTDDGDDGGDGEDTGDAGALPLVARLTVDVDAGEFPLRVEFDGTDSDLGSGAVSYEWSFGDGTVTGDGEATVHTYVGPGDFVATLTLVDNRTGGESAAEVTIEVDYPDCPVSALPLALGYVDDSDLEEISGIASSRIDPYALWVNEDSDEEPRVVAIDPFGFTLGEYELPDEFEDLEDIDLAVDPATGTSFMFLGDTGDNDHVRTEIAVWVIEEPDPFTDGELEPLRMALTYPDGPHDAETLLVDPLTLDVFVVTKDSSNGASVYLKRAPHDDAGPFVLEPLGAWPTIDITATGGDVSADGFRVVVRDYSDTALMFMRDGYQPLERAFDGEPCEIEIHDEEQGEAITFTVDGSGVVTTSEGVGESLYFIAF